MWGAKMLLRHNNYYHFCILFGNVNWLKTGHMTFYKKWHSTDVTNYSNTHAILSD